MGEASFVTVHVATSVAEGELVTELLRAEGIPAHLSSVSSAILGAAPHLFQTKVLVPAEDAARAAELLQDLVRASAEEGAAQALAVGAAPDLQSPVDGAGAGGGAGAAALAPRRPRVAAAFAFLFPGGGHLYARSIPTAIVVEIGMGACLFLLLRGPSTVFPQYAGFATVIALAFCDAWGAARLVRENNQGAPPLAPRRAISRGVILLALAAGAGSGVAALAAMPRWSREKRLAPFSVWCGQEVIAFHNGAPGPRVASLGRVRVWESGPDNHRWFDVTVNGSDSQRLEASADGSASIGIWSGLAARCAQWDLAGKPLGCLVTFNLEFEDRTASPRPERVSARGVCRPPWGQSAERRPARLLPAEDD